ncbi:hypothetical protein BDB01DRAFT_259295 [Pilobolus umbonatus]|nr:hypothetical protein BDB01DRAFT_259295 [Pilobolus umbonatus]
MMDSYSMPARDKDGNWVKTEDFLKICYLEQYTSIFINEGFESFESIREITEDDLIALQVKRGHRRVIQRNIATLNGIPRYHPIMMTNVTNTASMHVADMPNPYSTSGYESLSSMDRKDSLPRSIPIEGPSTPTQSTNIEMAMRSCSFSSDEGDTANESSKRKYRRHPKLDKNAPIKPTSAYIMFSNHVRNEFKEKNISFAELAKIVGDRWKRLDPAEKNKYESIASREKDEYTKTVKEYQKTEEYKNYQSYLTDFKKKQDSINKRITRFRRRAKLERADRYNRRIVCCSNQLISPLLLQ